MRVLAISGSIRDGSSSAALLKAVRSLLPASLEWVEFKIRELSFFDPELQFSSNLPALVQEFRDQAQKADYLFISTPEYAHGIPGILKNALEWLICEETMQKKVIVFVCAPSGGEYVKEYLLETLRTMDLDADERMSFVINSARKDISRAGEILSTSLKSHLTEFLQSVGVS